jgi:uncharacterized protein YqjF (DUF2071 family)
MMPNQTRPFNYAILDEVAHRPWPMPDSPWIMTQTWHDLLFAHWPVDKVRLASLIPDVLELDLFDGEAWVGIVPFHMTNVAPRGVPSLPWVSAFPELNVRTYVRAGGKPGVYFFSLDAGNPLAVAAARGLFNLPYFVAAMEVEEKVREIHYRSRRTASDAPPAELVASYAPAGPVFTATPGTLEYFLTERYCLFTVADDGHARRLDIHHPPWPLQPANAMFQTNTMADAAGLRLPSRAPLLHFAKRQDMVAWTLQRVDT